jgi:hypothetical protein
MSSTPVTPNASNAPTADVSATPPNGPRLTGVLSAITSALATIPDTGRPNFLSGLGDGARDAQASEAGQPVPLGRSF